MAERKARSSNHGEVRINRTVSAHTYTQEDRAIPTLKVPKVFQGFIDFIREQGVVGVGVGFIVGTSAVVLIKSIVTNLVNPFIGLLTGGIDLSQKTACLDSVNGVCKNTLNYGQVLSDLIYFMLILLVVYLIIKILRLEKLDKPKKSK